MQNIPEVSLGIIAVSRDCFPIALSEKRRAAIIEACGGGLYECPVTVENENDMCRAVEDVKKAGFDSKSEGIALAQYYLDLLKKESHKS